MDQDLGRTVAATEGARDLAVIHAERKAHDQRLPSIVWKLRDAVEHPRQLVAALRDLLGGVGSSDWRSLVERALRLARAVAIEIGGEVVGDADQPRAQRPPVGLALRALEMAVGLQEGLLCQVLRIVMVPDAVVGVAVDVAQMGAVELRELRVELDLGLLRLAAHSLQPTLPHLGSTSVRALVLVGAHGRDAAEPLPLKLDARPDSVGHRACEAHRRICDAREGARRAADG